jgi:hypothetical protein
VKFIVSVKMLFNKIVVLGLVYCIGNVFDFIESKTHQLTEQESRAVEKVSLCADLQDFVVCKIFARYFF